MTDARGGPTGPPVLPAGLFEAVGPQQIVDEFDLLTSSLMAQH